MRRACVEHTQVTIGKKQKIDCIVIWRAARKTGRHAIAFLFLLGVDNFTDNRLDALCQVCLFCTLVFSFALREQQKSPKRFWRGGAGECLFLQKGTPPHHCVLARSGAFRVTSGVPCGRSRAYASRKAVMSATTSSAQASLRISCLPPG